MKRRLYLLILFAAVTISSMAQNIGEAFYIYRNDGQLNAFIREEVESMEYSYEDAEGNIYDEIVTQIVITPDSVYKIPIAAIDSISFVTPETKYKPGVKVLEGTLRQYVVSSNEMQVVFSSQTPQDILPKIGDKLVTLEQSEVFPSGFLGEVCGVSPDENGNIIVSCELADVRDVFKCYYGVSYGSYTNNNSVRLNYNRAVDQGVYNFSPGPFRLPLTDDWSASLRLNDRFAYIYSPNFVFEFAPTFHIKAYFIRPDHEDTDLYISLTVYGDFHMTQRIGGSGTLQCNRDWGINDPLTGRPRLSTPIPQCPLITFYCEPGVFLRAASKLSFQLDMSQDYRLVFHYDVSPLHGSEMQPTLRFYPVATSYSGQVSMNGNVALGAYAELGFLIADKRFAHLCFRAEGGWELESQAVLTTEDFTDASTSTTTYEVLRKNSLNINKFIGTRIEGRLWALPITLRYNLPLSRKDKIASLAHVPTFSNVSLESTDDGSLEASAEVRGYLLNPVNVGFTLFDEKGNKIGTYFAETPYQNQASMLTFTFNNLRGGQSYTVYPVVMYNNLEVLASPSSSAELYKYPVEITDFEQTGSQYKENGFTNGGKQYSYKFDCAVTIELINSKNVEDWGYIYESPEGGTTRISLISQNSPYTDTQSFYYCNEPSSTVRLYEYVKYTGDSKYYYGEPKDYPVSHKEQGLTSCPDNNHPHWIDLGLPSGTQWRCCNEGASTPEDYGKYYTFGQIASAPTLDQIIELRDNTTSEWTTQNRVKGRRFTGHNGGTIFLPAAGLQSWNGEIVNRGSEGSYWSSTSEQYGSLVIYDHLLFNSSRGAHYGSYNSRHDFRLPVRPVR